MRPVWKILSVSGGYLVAWRDLGGAWGEYTTDEPLSLWYRMYRDYRARRGGWLVTRRLLNEDDTQEVVPLKASQRDLRIETEEMRKV